jgi:hypothetical protein
MSFRRAFTCSYFFIWILDPGINIYKKNWEKITWSASACFPCEMRNFGDSGKKRRLHRKNKFKKCFTAEVE